MLASANRCATHVSSCRMQISLRCKLRLEWCKRCVLCEKKAADVMACISLGGFRCPWVISFCVNEKLGCVMTMVLNPGVMLTLVLHFRVCGLRFPRVRIQSW